MSFSFDQNTTQDTTNTTLKAMAIKKIDVALNFCYQKHIQRAIVMESNFFVFSKSTKLFIWLYISVGTILSIMFYNLLNLKIKVES